MPILVKVPRLRDIGDLHERGASDIVAGEFETALEAVTRVLHAGGVAEEAMGELLAALRHEGVPEHGPVSGPRRMLGTMGACGAARRRRARTCTSCGPTCRRGARAARSEHWGWCYIDALEIDPLLPSPPLETRRRPSSPVPPRPAG